MADSFKSSNSIANLIQKWASENSKKVGAAIHFKGGWEGWAQVEIAYEMVMAYSTPMVSDQHRQGMRFDVAREEKVYKNKPGDIVDLVIHMLSNAARTDARDTYLIELKCESQGSDSSSETFKKEVKKDSAKFDAATGIKQEYLPRDKAVLYSIAISTRREGHEWMVKEQPTYTLNPAKADESDLIRVWWKRKELGP